MTITLNIKGAEMIQVTAAIIEKNGKILIARRKKDSRLGGLWEFPGGKLKCNETPQECLKRELKEELGIDARIGAFVASSKYDYEHISIELLAYKAEYISGEISLIDHDAIAWITEDEFNNYNFAPADIPIIHRLKDKTMDLKKIILASASPRRKDLLENINLKFEIIPSQAEENIDEETFSNELIENLALDKAMDVKNRVDYPAVIIGADTVVVIDNIILGKPKDKQDAFRMLKLLSGKTHEVISAIAIIDTAENKTLTDSVISAVTFKELSDSEINNYIATEEPMDKAGAYAIQGFASVFISKICGDYTNIVGISTYKLAEMLKELGIRIL